MAGKPIDNLSIIVSANTNPLAQDLQRAAREVDSFAKSVQRSRQVDVSPRLNTAYIEATRLGAMRREMADIAARRRDLTAFGKPTWAGVAGRELWGGAKAFAGVGGRVAYAGAERLAGAAGGAAESMLAFAKSVGPVAVGTAAAEAGLNGLAGAFLHVRDSVVKAGELEQTKLAFEVMLRDAREANEHVADLRRFAATTPFSTRETIDASRQLIAYGRSADAAMRDLRMLGDVSAAFGRRLPLGDLTYLYGTLYAQQRAYTKDLFQFSNRGIPIYRELGKVLGKSGAELQQWVEDGRVGFEHVRQAFEAMTAEGGAFYGMTQRQSRTFLGQWERMSDAIDITRTRFGGLLIEELGLGEATRDIEAFAARVEHGMEGMRPAVRMLGQLGRAAVQVGHEFARAGVEVASLTFRNYAEHLPGLREMGDEVKRLVEDMGQFKINDRDLIRGAFAFGRAMADTTVNIGERIGTYGEGMASLFESIVRSSRMAAEYMQQTARFVDRINDALPANGKMLANPIGELVIGPMLRGGLDRLAAVDPLAGRRDADPIRPAQLFGPPMIGQSPDRVRAEYGHMRDMVRAAEQSLARTRQLIAAGTMPAGSDAGPAARLADANIALDRYAGAFEGALQDAHRHLLQGNVPAIRPLTPAVPDFLGEFERDLRGVRDIFGQMRRWDAGELKDRLNRSEFEALAAYDAQRAAEHAAAVQGRQRQDALAAGLGPAAVIQSPPNRAADRQAAWGAALGPIGAFRDGLPPIPPDVEQLRLDLRREYNPMVELEPFRAQLDTIRGRGLLGENTNAITDLAWTKKVREVAGRFGIGTPAQLPSAAEVGSSEDARLITAWRTQNEGGQTAEDLLRQLLEVARMQLTVQRGGFEAFKVPDLPAHVSWFPW